MPRLHPSGQGRALKRSLERLLARHRDGEPTSSPGKLQRVTGGQKRGGGGRCSPALHTSARERGAHRCRTGLRSSPSRNWDLAPFSTASSLIPKHAGSPGTIPPRWAPTPRGSVLLLPGSEPHFKTLCALLRAVGVLPSCSVSPLNERVFGGG